MPPPVPIFSEKMVDKQVISFMWPNGRSIKPNYTREAVVVMICSAAMRPSKRCALVILFTNYYHYLSKLVGFIKTILLIL